MEDYLLNVADASGLKSNFGEAEKQAQHFFQSGYLQCNQYKL